MRQFSKRIKLTTIVFFLTIAALRAQTFNWVTGGGTTATLSSLDLEGTYFTCTDPNGNVYALSRIGYYTVYADTFTGATYSDCSLITSYNCEGQMRWAKVITSSGGYCRAIGIAADSSGHIYVGGSFPNATLKIGLDTTIATHPDLRLGVIKFDTSGHFDWIRQVGADVSLTYSITDILYGSVAVDKEDNIHLVANLFYSGLIFSPGDTSHSGNYDIKWNPSGTMLSAKRLALDSTIGVMGAIIDKQSNTLYAYGYRNPDFCSCTFGGTGDSSAYNFIAAFDTNGNKKWVDTAANVYPYEQGLIQGAAVDGAGHIYLSGFAYSYITFEGNTTYAPPGAYSDIAFIIKIDTAGHLEWVSQCDGNSTPNLSGITVMPNNKIASVGSFEVTIKKDAITLDGGGGDGFLYIVDTGGNMVDLKRIHGSAAGNGAGAIACDKVGNLYIGGGVIDSILEDYSTTLTPYVSVGGNSDFFVAKYGIDCSCTNMPTANYSVTGTHTVTATYTGTTAPAIDSVVWSFGDGDTATGTIATHVYTVSGSVDLCVTVYTGCGRDTHCSTILVNCTTVTSAFTDTGTTVRGFTYTGTTAGIDSVKWNFGDGHTALGTTPIHTYSTSGTYTVCATVYTGCGSNTSCNTIVINCTPTSSFTSTGTTTRDFTYTGTTISLDSVKWTFGDGYTATGTTAVHTYSASGTYTVCCTVYTACGSNTSCSSIVINCTPVSSFTYSGTDPVNFTYTGTTSGLDSVVWTFGDGHTATGTTVSHTYSASGTYTVCATAHAMCGVNTSCNTVIINCTPVSSFTYSGTSPVNFTYTGSTFGLDSVVWHYGDGTTGAGTTTTHIYTASGTYSVCVTAYALCGSNTSCSLITIDCSPTASFTISGFIIKDFTYTGTTAGLDSVVWNFGDTTATTTGTSAVHTYTAIGTYTVCVTAYTPCGNSTVCNTVTISCLTAPVAAFLDTGSNPHFFGYLGTLGGYDSLSWSYGDGTTFGGVGTAFEVTHTYSTTGTFEVCVTVYTQCGDDSACKDIVITTAGVPIVSMSDIQVFPNPAGDELNITGVQNNTAYKLLTVTGVSIEKGMLHSGNNTIKLINVAAGVYVLEMTDVNGVKNIIKIIKE